MALAPGVKKPAASAGARPSCIRQLRFDKALEPSVTAFYYRTTIGLFARAVSTRKLVAGTVLERDRLGRAKVVRGVLGASLYED